MVGVPDDPGLLGRQLAATVTAAEMNRLAGTVARGAMLLATQQVARDGLGRAVQALRDEAAEARTADEWNPLDQGASLPTVDSVQQQIESLEAQIEQQREALAELQNQRDDRLTRAGGLEQQSELAGGEAALQPARQATDLRNEVAGLTTQITLAEAELRRSEEELARLRALLQGLTDAAAQIEEQARGIAEQAGGGDGVEARIAELNRAISQAVEGQGEGPAEPPSMTQLAGRLSEQLAAADELRQAALSDLDVADADYDQAQQRARAAGSPLAGRADVVSRGASTVYEDVGRQAQLGRAIVQRQRGEVHRADAAMHAGLLRLRATAADAREAGRPLPEDVTAAAESAAGSFGSAVTQSAAALQDAQNAIEQTLAGARGATQGAALTQRALVISAMISLRDLVESTGRLDPEAAEVQVDLPTRDELLASADEVRQFRRGHRGPPAARHPRLPLRHDRRPGRGERRRRRGGPRGRGTGRDRGGHTRRRRGARPVRRRAARRGRRGRRRPDRGVRRVRRRVVARSRRAAGRLCSATSPLGAADPSSA